MQNYVKITRKWGHVRARERYLILKCPIRLFVCPFFPIPFPHPPPVSLCLGSGGRCRRRRSNSNSSSSPPITHQPRYPAPQGPV